MDTQNDVINDSQMPLVIGLEQLQIKEPSEIVLNNQGNFIIVSNLTQIQILKSVIDFGNQ
mgnify:CR=1 FL=1|jgi:hypothetical protein